MSKAQVIAIDGPSGTGKSTVAKGVAKRLKFAFFDTGAMYRSMAWWIDGLGINPEDEKKIQEQLPAFSYKIQTDAKGHRIYIVNGTDVTDAIRSPKISTLASKISTYSDVRKELVKIQREFGSSQNAVFEGRDMGTVVFPEAQLKIFLTADPKVRAERRYRELTSKFPHLESSMTVEQILADIEKRDHADRTRAISPLKQADDAILIDTSFLTAEQVIEKIVAIIEKKHRKFPWFYRLIYTIARAYVKLLYRLQIYGIKHLRIGPAILAANHASLLDPPVVSVSSPYEVHFLAKASLFKIPLLGSLIRRLNSHPVARNASDAATFKLLIHLLQNGKKVLLFPEGGRTPNGQLQPIERGLPFLMMKAKCPIQPVYVQGTFEVWPITRKFPKFSGHISCVFGSPILWEEFEALEKKEAERQILQRMEKALKDLKKWVEDGAQGTPP